ncbi:LysE family translocator [Granulosicoccus antarcticus]|uniref:Leucine efflux protein n=1 Tax=Granulosicoccus antarcticus IMCC3135 TaxID=1192854 RepID=A0A2Z2P4A7_9GAMM|nr:LysE family translocator [Granulosicoccus antarcticus]ASJ76260.1 Leucine efflux protein [Granulosicoccus antarcticus IMCC3135]
MGVFLTAVFFLLITPGPGVLSTAGVGSSFGASPGYRYVAGLFIGTNLVALAVVTGLAGLVLAQPALRTILMYASIAYLCYLAFRIAFAGSKIRFIQSAKPPGIRDAVLLQAINPKAYVVNTALFTGFPFAGMALWQETTWKFLLMNLIWVPIHLLWLAAGIGLQKLDLPDHWHRAINIVMALSLLMVILLAIKMA